METIWKDCTENSSYLISSDGLLRNKRTGLVLKKRLSTRGYVTYRFYVNGKSKELKAHRLVALAFIPNPDGKPIINHINGIKTDNRISNLEWSDYSNNILHAYKIGLAKISDRQKELCRIRSTGNTYRRKRVLNMDNGDIYDSLTIAS